MTKPAELALQQSVNGEVLVSQIGLDAVPLS
jgi:hypothetical protein